MGVKQTSRLGLPGLRRQLEAVNSPEFSLRMARNLAEEARTQVSDGFQQQRDPYGNAWAPLQNPPKHRLGGMILQDTGRMAASVSTHVTSFGFRLDIPVTYAAPHQYGAKKRGSRGGSKRKPRRSSSKRARSGRGLPQRQMVPMVSTGGLGPIWSASFRRVSVALLDQHFKRAA